jgi:branched-chain amino acid transport system permease protein
MSSADFLSLLVSGVSIGSIYAMAGVSLNIAYRPTNVFNLAQGCLIAIGMMFAWGLMSELGLPWLIGVPAVVLAVAAAGLIEERLAVAPLRRFSGHAHGWIITTLAFSIILENVADHIWGSDPRAVPPIPGTSLDTLELNGVGFTSHQIAAFAIAIASIAAIEYFYRYARLGRAVLAVAEDRDGARLCGISPTLLTMGSFAVAGAYAALDGVLAAPVVLASTGAGLDMLIKGFMALAIGGVGSNWGALLGGILIAVIESLCSAYASPGPRQLIVMLVLLAVLLARPHGLFGRAAMREV